MLRSRNPEGLPHRDTGRLGKFNSKKRTRSDALLDVRNDEDFETAGRREGTAEGRGAEGISSRERAVVRKVPELSCGRSLSGQRIFLYPVGCIPAAMQHMRAFARKVPMEASTARTWDSNRRERTCPQQLWEIRRLWNSSGDRGILTGLWETWRHITDDPALEKLTDSSCRRHHHGIGHLSSRQAQILCCRSPKIVKRSHAFPRERLLFYPVHKSC